MNTNPENLPAVVEVLPPAQLPAATAHLNDLHGQVCAALDRAWQTGVVLGMELVQLKQSLPHGEFGKLFDKANLNHGLNFSQQMAARYMTLYRECLNAAGRLERGEAVAQMLEGYRAAYALEHNRKGELMRRHASRALSRELTALAPQAHSMRQALFAFMEPAEKPAPTFAERNTKGRVMKPTDEAALRESVTEEMEQLAARLMELAESGRYTIPAAAARDNLSAACRVLLAKLKEVHA